MMNADANPVIEAAGLTKRFGDTVAVDRVDVHLNQGEVLGFLGPNGAGKTTTVKLLLGLVKPTAGNVRVFGEPLTRNSRAQLSRVGAVVEAPAFYPYMSGKDNLRTMTAMVGAEAARIGAVLEEVGLADASRTKFGDYSVGMKQRLGIASVLLRDPDLVILDEPTSGLDPAGQRDVGLLIQRLAEAGKAVFLSSHQMAEVERVCDRIMILKSGKVAFEGTLDEMGAGGSLLHVRVLDPDGAVQVLEGIDWVQSVELRDGHLVVDIGDQPEEQLTAALAHQGHYVTELRRQGLDLEQLYFEATGQLEDVA